jgi:phosphate uptake regulator
MKRNIVRHGPSTLTISLPAAWVKKNNLHPKSVVEVEEDGSKLVIKTKKEDEFESISVKIKNNYKTGIRYINSSYRKGYDEIDLSYENSNYLKRIEKCLTEDILGFEIIRQGKNSCTIRDIPGTKFEEFDTLLGRTWIIILNICKDVEFAIKNKDREAVDTIMGIDKRVNKFTNFCIRVLNKRGHPKYKNIPLYYRFLRGMEELADDYKYMLVDYSDSKGEPSKEFFSILNKLNNHVDLFYKTFYKPEDTKIEYLLVESKKMYMNIRKATKEKNPLLMTSLYEINDKIRTLISTIVEMNME